MKFSHMQKKAIKAMIKKNNKNYKPLSEKKLAEEINKEPFMEGLTLSSNHVGCIRRDIGIKLQVQGSKVDGPNEKDETMKSLYFKNEALRIALRKLMAQNRELRRLLYGAK